jgi:hypothetical protein
MAFKLLKVDERAVNGEPYLRSAEWMRRIKRGRGSVAAKMPEDASDLLVLTRKKNLEMRVEVCSKRRGRGRTE